MASTRKMRTRGKRSIGFFADLNSISVADFCPESKPRRRTVDSGRFFEVERIISSREGQQEREYLVKWKNFSSFDASWEPKQHLNQLCLKYYEHPKPERNVILNEVSRLRVAIGTSLKASTQRKQVTVEFREDVFKHLFGKKGVQNGRWKVLAQEEFSPSFFPPNWHCLLDLHGQGTKVLFPIKIRHFLSWSTQNYHLREGIVTKSTRAFLEKLTVDFIKVAA